MTHENKTEGTPKNMRRNRLVRLLGELGEADAQTIAHRLKETPKGAALLALHAGCKREERHIKSGNRTIVRTFYTLPRGAK